MSDASPDVEGIETPPWLVPTYVLQLSDASPDVEGIETFRKHRRLPTWACQMHSPMLRALKLLLNGVQHRQQMSDASPDVEGIETHSIFNVFN